MKTVLVGNGGSLLKRSLGELIDSHDRVVRINRCKTSGYERHVGSRTDLWLISIQGGLGRFKWPNTGERPRTMMMYSLSSHQEIKTTLAGLLDPTVELMPLEVALEVSRFAGDHYPSTGLTAAIMLKPCFIAGFDHWTDERNHYGDDLESPRSHHYGRERELFSRLEQLGHIIRL